MSDSMGDYLGTMADLTPDRPLDAYLILDAEYSSKLEDEISVAVEDGWQLVGPISVGLYGHNAKLFCATMKKRYVPAPKPVAKTLTATEQFRENQSG